MVIATFCLDWLDHNTSYGLPLLPPLHNKILHLEGTNEGGTVLLEYFQNDTIIIITLNRPTHWTYKRACLQSKIPTSSRQRASSWAFSLENSSSGYCSLGNGAMGQSNVGTSSLWMDLECVVAKQPEQSGNTTHLK